MISKVVFTLTNESINANIVLLLGLLGPSADRSVYFSGNKYMLIATSGNMVAGENLRSLAGTYTIYYNYN